MSEKMTKVSKDDVSMPCAVCGEILEYIVHDYRCTPRGHRSTPRGHRYIALRTISQSLRERLIPTFEELRDASEQARDCYIMILEGLLDPRASHEGLVVALRETLLALDFMRNQLAQCAQIAKLKKSE
jgi:hypothetical protein